MKKLLAIILTLAVFASCSMTALAAQDVTANGGTQNIDVSANYEGNINTEVKISVEIKWDAMSFTYTETTDKYWSATDHAYSSVVQGEWTASGNTVTVANHSNVDVNVGFGYSGDIRYGDITGTFTFNKTVQGDGTIKLGSGENTSFAEADSVKANLMLDGKLVNVTSESSVHIGTISVVIRKDA